MISTKINLDDFSYGRLSAKEYLRLVTDKGEFEEATGYRWQPGYLISALQSVAKKGDLHSLEVLLPHLMKMKDKHPDYWLQELLRHAFHHGKDQAGRRIYSELTPLLEEGSFRKRVVEEILDDHPEFKATCRFEAFPTPLQRSISSGLVGF